jgi:streptogramin lyase
MFTFQIRSSAAALAIICTSFTASAQASPMTKPAVRADEERSTHEVVYVADRSQGRVLIYPADRANPAPIGSFSYGIVEVEGIAVAANGDLYVANGSGGDVIVYPAGGAGRIHTLTSKLSHPVNVALDSAGNIYVAEQNPSSIVKFSALGNVTAVYDLPNPNDPVRGVTVDARGDIFASISGIPDVYPIAWCEAVTDLYEIPVGTNTPIQEFLRGNEQAFGLAIDGLGRLYASDPCLDNVAVYDLSELEPIGFWRSSGPFSVPFYLTIANGYLSVPSSANGVNGFVTVIPLNGTVPYQTITSGLKEPVSAVVGTIP